MKEKPIILVELVGFKCCISKGDNISDEAIWGFAIINLQSVIFVLV